MYMVSVAVIILVCGTIIIIKVTKEHWNFIVLSLLLCYLSIVIAIVILLLLLLLPWV